ncbi:MAG: ABC transporter ATP-binding protein [Chloroflexi bacterium]|nr:ABC transporter ATP-binding protein [Chloroflexota bacterium]
MNENADDDALILDVRNLSVDYIAHGRPPAHALEKVSFQLRKGEMLGIVGESGCGKTTLMLSLMRLLPAAGRIVNGEINFLGADLLNLNEKAMADVRWKNIAMIFQGAMNALNPVRTVGSQIAEPIARHTMNTLNDLHPIHNANRNGKATQSPNGNGHYAGKNLNPLRTVGSQIAETIKHHEAISDKGILDRRVAELLDLVGISPNRRDQYPHQYSGGMRQRAMIAMALACFPDVIIADEPTTALDVMVQAQILELLATLRQQLGLSVLFVTHDLGVVAEVCDSVMVMYGGVVAEYSDVDTIYNSPQHPYTQELLKAFPDVAHPHSKLTSIPGYPPRLDALPAGCRFAPRCPCAFARCHQAPPPLYHLGKFHEASCYLVEKTKVGIQE